jgi:hypothetical protein
MLTPMRRGWPRIQIAMIARVAPDRNSSGVTCSPETTGPPPPGVADVAAGAADTATAAPYSSQNRTPVDSAAPHPGHGRGNAVPQEPQTRAPGRLS